ncbi:MAG: STAS domain-containing protein [Acidimicrobiales bacterium]
MSSDFAFEVVDMDGVHVVSLYGQLDLANAQRVREMLVETGGTSLVVDLSRLQFMDSSGIAALLGARNEIITAGQEFELRGAQGIVRRVLEVSGLSYLLAAADADGADAGIDVPQPD